MSLKTEVSKTAAKGAAVGAATSVGSDVLDRVTESLNDFDPISEFEDLADGVETAVRSAGSAASSKFSMKKLLVGLVIVAAVAAAIRYFRDAEEDQQ